MGGVGGWKGEAEREREKEKEKRERDRKRERASEERDRASNLHARHSPDGIDRIAAAQPEGAFPAQLDISEILRA